jgi:hypothetical protein
MFRFATGNAQVNTTTVKPSNRLIEAEKQTRQVLNGLSVLRQLGEHLDLPTAPPLLEELLALARAQRRALKATHTQLEADPLLGHLLKSRIFLPTQNTTTAPPQLTVLSWRFGSDIFLGHLRKLVITSLSVKGA